MSDTVKIQLDLATGTVNIESPADSLDVVFEKLGAFLPQLADAYAEFAPAEGDDTDITGNDEQSDSETSEMPTTQKSAAVSRAKTSSRRESHKETYKSADLKLDEGQRNAFRQFFADKAPKGQNDQLLTIVYWLQREGEKSSVDKDEIFTGFRTVDAPVPGRISSVLTNLRLEGMVVPQDDGKYVLHHVGEDHVKFKLPKKKAT
jgi:hypothetical protein